MRFRLALLLMFLSLPAIAADALPRPTASVLLTVSGSIANTNAGKEAKFDRAMLEKLGVRTLRTSTTSPISGSTRASCIRATRGSSSSA